ncbi:multi-sensor hybrid histidine kinase [Candidatus Moduliflexus flocculans]|uniref:histidine kinase n=1 Tax=Candidatus Moduliflexus flocculans TaxID=1499966 RepID=A0A0S6VQP0_9BACT|nr:multi-sensor hybrid histidine kinase [Candidatus Moduliflexus flocculans]
MTVGLIILIVSVLTAAIVLNAANILTTAMERELSQHVTQGIAVFTTFLEWQQVNLELWNAQPIVNVFFNSPALATLSRPGLEAYFKQAKANAPWIANIWLIDHERIIYDHANVLDAPFTRTRLPGDLMAQIMLITPFMMNLKQVMPDQEQWVLVLPHQFSKDGVIQEGKYLVLTLDANQMNVHLFRSREIGHQGFLTYLGETPEGTLIIPEQRRNTNEQADYAQVSPQWQRLADIPDRYHSIFLAHQALPNMPITVLGVASRNDIQQPIRELIRTSIWLGGIILCVGLAGALLFSEKLTNPLRTLTGIVSSITRDNLSGQVLLEQSGLFRQQNELGVFARTFAMMLATIQEYTAHLEEKVVQRTQELARAKDVAEAAQKTAEHANQAKSAFLANMGHELRSPLNAILGFAQVMSRSQTLPPEHREHLAIISRSGDHLLLVINQILDLAKIEAGRITADIADLDLPRLLDEVYNLFSLRAEQKGLQFVFCLSPNAPRRIRSDAVKLRQVLINLLNNALKFTQKGSVITRVSMFSDGEASDRASLYFEIEDTGPGIAPEELAQIFEPFVQTTAGRQAREGTGLGLPISRKFAQLLDGDITVKSEPGVGSIFAFTISCEVCASADAPPEATLRRVVALEPGQPSYRILIADDSPDNRGVLIALLRPLGFDLREATDGQETFDLWRKWQPQIILLDMRLPVIDGYETVQKIRAEEMRQVSSAGGRCGIIALKASAFEEERAAVLAAGCDEFVRKPFKEEEIFALLQKRLGLRYIYDEKTGKSQPPAAGTFLLDADALAELPDHMLKRLFQAVSQADVELTQTIIEQIRLQNAPLADVLIELVENYRFDLLLTVAQQTVAMRNNANCH